MIRTAKALGVLLTVAVTAWLAGVGFTIGFGETAASIALVPEIKETVDLNTTRIGVLEDSVSSASSQRRRIICISRIAATGELLNAFDLDLRCP